MSGVTSPMLVAVGDNCLDAFLNKDLLTVGGNALNVAAQWRRNGWPARYFGAVGTDREAEVVLAEIAAVGLASDDVERRPGETAVTLIHDEKGERTFLHESFGVGEHYLPPPDRYHVIAAASWVHLGTNANAALVRRLVADGVRFSIDVSTSHLALPLEGVPLVFASGSDRASAEAVLGKLKAAGAREVVLTCGRYGAFFYGGGTVLHAAAIPIEIVDTCGAGDSFIATFLTASRCERLGPGEALHKAAAAAAETCTHLGGFPQQLRPIPDWLPAKYAAAIAEKEESRA
jgi:fructoselysine 6-kinase